jgi:hypothetical protein
VNENKETPLQPCQALLHENGDALAQLARETIDEGYAPKDFVVLCLDTAHPEWRKVIEHLAAEYDLEINPDTSVLMGAMATRDAVMTFEQLVPHIAALLENGLKKHLVRILAIRGDSVGVFGEELEDEPTGSSLN